MSQQQPRLVSAHGGHSGQFCLHARDTLAEMVEEYARQGFAWVGLTEHMPPTEDAFLYPDEREAGLTANHLQQQFVRYVETARQLQQDYRGRLTLFVGMETEYYPGSVDFAKQLKKEFDLDYLVGSVHHVEGRCFDFSLADYQRAFDEHGGYEPLYCAYFDAQLTMINALQPEVVGHFDLIRLYDPDYPTRLQCPAVEQRMRRNLQRIRELGLILDYNARALFKGAPEPYVSVPVLHHALQLGIDLLPGDDSHGVDSVGAHLSTVIALLQDAGYHCQWRFPTPPQQRI
ncbi:histidinol-phosphatase [uncultured Desulfuromonas sp.]|uniref:histidinol-phosphatase n=1 Tax=uncultured Desulfuromonas sp. TaxID=181013 RepID=UPI002AAB3331|nr:histidinol-phosphatase [uncultured Desulfuromonas sp.]